MKKLQNTMLIAVAVALIAIPGLALADCGNAKAHAKTASEETPSIVGIAVDGGFKTLVAAVKAAGLAETLDRDGPFTVFAPTDEAFAKLPEGTVESLLANPEALKQVLLYHVVSGKVMAKDVVKLKMAKTLNGTKVAISAKDGVMINMSNVIKTDIEASNGVVHVIDTVLIPENM